MAAQCTTTPAPDAGPAPGLDAGRDAAVLLPDAGETDAAVDRDAGPDAADAGLAETQRVLFVGNSYTYFNDLPRVVASLGAADGVRVEAEVIASGGARFCDHSGDAETRARVSSGEHDAVVIQGQSVDMFYGGETAYYCAEGLGRDAVDAGARLVWFETWARREGNEFYSRGRGVTTPEEMTDFVDGFYESLSEWGAGGLVARVGRAFERILEAVPGVALHADDGSHPTPAGTLVAACAITQALTGRPPAVPSPAPFDLAPELAATLCDLATREPCFDALLLCGGECLSVAFDATHCGACDSPCPGPRECWRGACECAPSFELPITAATLTALDPVCDPTAARPAETCSVAAHLGCAGSPCGGSGVGPFVTEEGQLRLVCADARVIETTWTALAAHHATCDGVVERSGDACRTAAHLACLERGAAAGFGPVRTTDGEAVDIACVDRAEARFVPHAAIDAWGCEGYPARAWDAECDGVVHAMCTGMGYHGGYGPLETSTGRDDGVDIVCFRR